MKSFRLTVSTEKQLKSISEKYKISQAEVIMVLVHCFYMGLKNPREDAEKYFKNAGDKKQNINK